MFFNKYLDHPLMKIARILKYPVLLIVAVGGIIVYNGLNAITVDPTFEYLKFNSHDRAERFLRDNYTTNNFTIESLLDQSAGQYVFFQKGIMIGDEAPFNMTFLYQKGFPIDSSKILWRAADDRFNMNLTECYVYQKNKKIFLKVAGTLHFEVRPVMDLYKKQLLMDNGFEVIEGKLSKPFTYDVQLSN